MVSNCLPETLGGTNEQMSSYEFVRNQIETEFEHS